jgi:hypothetical protein
MFMFAFILLVSALALCLTVSSEIDFSPDDLAQMGIDLQPENLSNPECA